LVVTAQPRLRLSGIVLNATPTRPRVPPARIRRRQLRAGRRAVPQDTERAMLMGGACAKAYGWSPKKG